MSVFGTAVFNGKGATGANHVSSDPIAVSKGDLLIVAVSWLDTGTASVDDSGGVNVYTPGTRRTPGFITGGMQYFRCLAAAADDPALVVTAHLSTANSFATIGVTRVSLSGGTAAFDVESNTGTDAGGTVTTGAYTTTGSDEFVAMFLCDGGLGVGGWAPQAGYTLDSAGYGALGAGECAAEHTIFSSTQTGITSTMTKAGAGGGGGGIAIAFKAVPTFSISGNAGHAGVTVVLSGDASASTVADGSGNYSFANLNPGNYVVTPSKTGFIFTPTSQAETIVASNITGVNFTAKASYRNHRSK